MLKLYIKINNPKWQLSKREYWVVKYWLPNIWKPVNHWDIFSHSFLGKIWKSHQCFLNLIHIRFLDFKFCVQRWVGAHHAGGEVGRASEHRHSFWSSWERLRKQPCYSKWPRMGGADEAPAMDGFCYGGAAERVSGGVGKEYTTRRKWRQNVLITGRRVDMCSFFNIFLLSRKKKNYPAWNTVETEAFNCFVWSGGSYRNYVWIETQFFQFKRKIWPTQRTLKIPHHLICYFIFYFLLFTKCKFLLFQR